MKKTVLRILLCFLAAVGLAAALRTLFYITVEKRIHPVTTYIAADDIMPRTKITTAHLIEVSIPQEYLLDGTCNTQEEIVGMYTDIQGMIPAGSPIYKRMLHTESSLPDYPATQLKQGQTCFSTETDASSLGSMVAGMRCDIHLTAERKEEGPINGCLLENVRILSVKDYQGIEITDEESSGIPARIEFAVQRKDLDLLIYAETLGKLRFFPSDRAYDTTKEAELCTGSSVLQWLTLQRTLSKEGTEEKKS